MIGSTLAGMVGVLLILLVVYDAIRTTLSVSSSGGPLTNRLVSGLWFVLLGIHRRQKSHAMLSSVGPWITVTLLMTWFLVAWLGWFLLFCSAPQAVVVSTTKATASLIERAYYTGYTLTTLGYGDYVPGTDGWRTPPVIAAANGFFLFTLSITYILNIITNVIQKRQTALSINALGRDPRQIIAATNDDGKFATLVSQLQPLQQSISTLGQQHLAYPILHYYHSETSSKALSLAIARLYQAISLVYFASPKLDTTTREQLSIFQRALEQFLDTLGGTFIQPNHNIPHIPELNGYAELPGFDKSSTEMHDYLASLPYQKILVAYVQKDGWDWKNVWQTEQE
ncbi:two pore domain potassium channel family protein [Vreelandella sulfidaeris]|uniref:Two pore domain potassium channel family protein n=1 Tax=Vreelandella sulfidaeris TaxID=115553 RepID=A0A365TR82_9GAMM|nr:potassium channel family protein [Halomonas sulfidaeris]RBI68190.1 two pore domain potassium channel family protein [Halomonas sulfidaeris]